MYEIERKDNKVIVRKGTRPLFMASPESYVVYKNGQFFEVSQVKDLTDEALMLALANAVDLADFT